MRNDTMLRVTHEATVSDTDRIAVDRFAEVQQLRANLSVLDPVADAEHITALAADLDELRARSTPAARTDNPAAVSAPVSMSNAVDVERASTRPRGLVTPPPTRAPSAARAASPTLYTAAAPTHTAATSRSADHGLG